jgi:hypothetical protein
MTTILASISEGADFQVMLREVRRKGDIADANDSTDRR